MTTENNNNHGRHLLAQCCWMVVSVAIYAEVAVLLLHPAYSVSASAGGGRGESESSKKDYRPLKPFQSRLKVSELITANSRVSFSLIFSWSNSFEHYPNIV
jgi:hypothetical protein